MVLCCKEQTALLGPARNTALQGSGDCIRLADGVLGLQFKMSLLLVALPS